MRGGGDIRAAREGLQVVVQRLAERSPVPAGGAAAASAIAQGAALLAKCVRIAALSKPVSPTAATFDALAAEAVSGFELDCEAFVGVLTTPRSQTDRLGAAWIRATAAPLDLASTAMDAAQWVPAVRSCARPPTVPDVDAAWTLLSAGAAIALANARANLVHVPGEQRAALRARLDELDSRARQHLAQNGLGGRRLLAEVVREVCARAAREAFEDAGYAGLCAEGRVERALDAIRSVSLEAALTRHEPEPNDSAGGREG